MEDQDIITLYWERSEEAIRATAEKYGGYCAAIIRRVLGDGRDSEECLNDTWLGAWNAMPPQRPRRLPPFLGRIARNTALDRFDYNAAQSRSGCTAVLEELAECVGGSPPWRRTLTCGGWGRPSRRIWTPSRRSAGGFFSGGTGTATPFRRSPPGTGSPKGR